MRNKVIAFLAFLTFFPEMAFAACGYGYYGYWPYRWPLWGMMPWGGMIMGFFWIVLLVGLIYFILRAVGNRHSFQEGPHRENPLEILKKRYARGEINREEYERMKKDLEE